MKKLEIHIMNMNIFISFNIIVNRNSVTGVEIDSYHYLFCIQSLHFDLHTNCMKLKTAISFPWLPAFCRQYAINWKQSQPIECFEYCQDSFPLLVLLFFCHRGRFFRIFNYTFRNMLTSFRPNVHGKSVIRYP